MFICPACGERGVPVASRFLIHLCEPLECRLCSSPLFAHPLQGAVGSATTLLFAVLGLAVLASAPPWLVAVLAVFVAAKVSITLAFPLRIDRGLGELSSGSGEP